MRELHFSVILVQERVEFLYFKEILKILLHLKHSRQFKCRINKWFNIFRLLLLLFCFVFVNHANRLPKSKRKRFNRSRVDMILNSANANGFLDLE